MPNRIILVTGANGSLGTSVTKRFLAASDTVIGASRRIRQSDFSGSSFAAIPADFTKFESVRELTASIIKQFHRIDVVVNVVGGFAGGHPIHETDDRTWMQMQDLNLTAAFNVSRAVLPHMRKAGAGRFIAIGSKTAEQAVANLGAYVVFKAALVTLVKTIALENSGSGITANVVLPGTMDTPANRAAMPKADPKNWIQPPDVANTVFWLAGDEAAHINGAEVPIA
jgi:NAD(P)-dependent dehydrogenase (short-subunit alcohol dehydrogenase family)